MGETAEGGTTVPNNGSGVKNGNVRLWHAAIMSIATAVIGILIGMASYRPSMDRLETLLTDANARAAETKTKVDLLYDAFDQRQTRIENTVDALRQELRAIPPEE